MAFSGRKSSKSKIPVAFNINDKQMLKRLAGHDYGNDFLGQGSYGRVYKCYLDNDLVGAKVLSKDKCDEKNINCWSKFNHQNIIKFYEFHKESYDYYIFMEYASNGTLRDYLKSSETVGIGVKYFFRWMEDLFVAMDFLHSQKPNPFIHRDIKTDNLLIDGAMRLKLSDFDTVREVDSATSSVLSSGGNLAFCAPEIYNKDYVKKRAHKCDLYSSGFILYEMFTSKPIVTGCHMHQVAFFLNLRKGSRHDKPEDCPSDIWKIISCCWKEDPDERPESAEVVLELIKESLENLKISPQVLPTCMSIWKLREFVDSRLKIFKGQTKPVMVIGNQGDGDGEFNIPESICVFDQNVLIADWANHRIQVFEQDADGGLTFLEKYEIEGWPRGVAVTESGNIVVSSLGSTEPHQIRILKPTAAGLEVYRTFGGEPGDAEGAYNAPCGVCISNDGSIFVADRSNHRIQMIKNDLHVKTVYNQKDLFPWSVFVNHQKDILITQHGSHCIQKVSLDGVLLKKKERYGKRKSKFSYPRGIKGDADGFVLVADKGNSRIVVLNDDLEFVSYFGEEFLKGPTDVGFLKNGRVVVSDSVLHQLVVF